MSSVINSGYDDPDSALQRALDDLENASGKPGKDQAEQHAKRICYLAYEHGLSETHLDSLVDKVIEPSGLDQTTLDNIIKHLYPAGNVPDSLVCKVVASLGQGINKSSLPVQAGLLRWLAMVYDVLSNRGILSRLYGTLFNLLDMISLRKPLCQLLAMITRRKHVKPFRVHFLLELSRQVGYEPAMTGLIKVCQDYYPDVVFGAITTGRTSKLSWHPNEEWRARLLAIREKGASRTEGLQQRQSGFKVFRSGNKAAVLPEVHTSHVNKKSTTLEEVENAEDFVSKLDKLELPNQAVSVLCDPLLQKYLSICPSDSSSKRIHHWLVAFFEEELELIQDGGKKAGDRLGSVLESILGYAQYTKALPPACERFLELYLVNWDGDQLREVILSLVPYVSWRSFDEFRIDYFDLIEAAILDDTPSSKVVLVEFYASVLQNWIIRISQSPSKGSAADAAGDCSNRESPSTTFTRLATLVDTLCLSLFESAAAPGIRITPAILSVYDLLSSASTLSSSPPTIRITLPSSALVYLLLFSPSVSTLSRLCSLLGKYKRSLETAMSTTTTTSSPEGIIYSRDFVNHFNGLIMDVCNAIWRNRAFSRDNDHNNNTTTVHTQGCMVPPTILPRLKTYLDNTTTTDNSTNHTLPTILSLTYSPTTTALSLTYLRTLLPSTTTITGPISPRSASLLPALNLTWPQFRLQLLHSLDRVGVGGLAELVRCTVRGVGAGSGGTSGAGG